MSAPHPSRHDQDTTPSTPSPVPDAMLWAVAIAFLLGALLTGYLGWTLMS